MGSRAGFRASVVALRQHRTMKLFGGRRPTQPTEVRQPSALPEQPFEPPVQHSEQRRLFTTFGFLVAKQGATAGLGLAYWAVATHLFLAARCGSGGRRVLGGILSCRSRRSRDPTPPPGRAGIARGCGPPRRLQHRNVHCVRGCPDPVVGHDGALPVPRPEPENHRWRVDDRHSLRDRIGGDDGWDHSRPGGNRTSSGLGSTDARQFELRAEACMRGRPGPRRDQNSHGPHVCLGTGACRLARRLYSPCFDSNRPRPAKGSSAIGWHSPAATACSPSSTTSSICRSTPSPTSFR